MEAIIDLMKNFDFAEMLPELDSVVGKIKLIVRLLVLVGPVLVLALGAIYYFKPPKEANFSWGFRTYYGMGSVEAWRYTQRIAGMCWMILGGGLSVIMLILGLCLGGLDAMGLVNTAVWCVGIELLLVLASCVGINVTVHKFYDKDGNRR